MAETARPVLRLESDDGGYLSHNNHHIVVPETVVDGFVKWLTDTFLTPTHKEEI